MPVGEKASHSLFIVSGPFPNKDDLEGFLHPFYILTITVLFSLSQFSRFYGFYSNNIGLYKSHWNR